MTRKRNTVGIRKTGQRRYRPVCIIATEGFTEQDYLKMDVFKDIPVSMKVAKKEGEFREIEPQGGTCSDEESLEG